ncbi:MAG TPA: hypothetical protein VG406_27790, partial [Isosphaeraceae bacterium]|nr:hypothetical protein [Isosphaeraceae bacterium]
MHSTPDRITRRDALARLAGLATLAATAKSRGGEDDTKERAPARIYFSLIGRQVEQRPEMAGILAVDPKDGTWTQVLPGPYQYPRVAPDGRRVLCRRINPEAERGLYVADLRGEDPPRRIAEGIVGTFSWWPDGSRVVYVLQTDATFANRQVNADGTGQAEAPIPATERILDVSPDGHWIVTSSSRPLEDGSKPRITQGAIYLMHPDGSGERRLLEGGRTRSGARQGERTCFANPCPARICNLVHGIQLVASS